MPKEYENYLSENSSKELTNQWTICYTDELTPYYVNNVTRKVSWNQPVDFEGSISKRRKNKRTNNGHSPTTIKRKNPYADPLKDE